MAIPIPFMGPAAPGRDGAINAQECHNMYLEQVLSNSKGGLTLTQTPGLFKHGSIGTGPIRGIIEHIDKLFVVSGSAFIEVDTSGGPGNWVEGTTHGTLDTSIGFVKMASSADQGNQIAIADGSSLYVYYDAAKSVSITAITRANPGVVTSVDHGLSNGDKLLFAILGTKATNSITAITKANPGVVSLVAHGYSNGDEVWLEDTTAMPEADKLTVTVANATSDTFEILDTSGFTLAATAGEAYIGMRELNTLTRVIENVADDTFDIKDTDTTGFSIYSGTTSQTRVRFIQPGFATVGSKLDLTTFTSVDENPVGNVAWTNPGNAISDDANKATATNLGVTNTGFGTATSTQVIARGGVTGWSNTDNAKTSNDSDATNTGTFLVNEQTDWLVTDTFAFTIPPNATILGVEVKIEGAESGGTGTDWHVSLYVDGTVSGDDKKIDIDSSSDIVRTVGSPTDLWSRTITPALANAATFGAAVYSQAVRTVGGGQVQVDHLTIKVYYNDESERLHGVNLSGFTFKTTDVMKGIEVFVDADAVANTHFSEVYILQGGAISGDNLAIDTPVPNAEAVTTFGSSTTLWGNTSVSYSAAVVNSNDFGLAVAFGNDVDQETATIDHLQMRFYFDSSGAVAPSFVEWMDNYFLIAGDRGRLYHDDNNGAQLWDNVNDFATAERDPDDLQAVIANYRNLWLIGTVSAEVWYNSGNVFPFSAIPNAFIEWGTEAPATVAKADEHVFWLGQNLRGAGVVLMSEGFRASKISTHEMEQELSRYPDRTDAIAFTYQQEGHIFYVLTFPSAGRTWVYDLATKQWHTRGSGISTGAIKVHTHHYFKDEKRHILGDKDDGNLYEWLLRVSTDDGDPIERVQVSQNIHGGLLHESLNRRRLFHHSFELEAQRGHDAIARPVNDEQTVELAWSDDDGKTYTDPIPKQLGRVGEVQWNAQQKLKWTMLGSSRDRIYKVITRADITINLARAHINVSPGTG